MSRKLLIILAVVLLVSLGLISQAKAKPKSNLSLLLSPYRKYAKWIEAQARHETDNYASGVYRENNNLFGMKNAFKRKQLGAISTDNVYRKYSSDGQSIRDLIKWFEFTNFPTGITSVEGYVQALKDRRYFGDSTNNYINGLKRFL